MPKSDNERIVPEDSEDIMNDAVQYSLTHCGTNGAVACRTSVMIKGKVLDAIIDTGASRTLLSKAAFDRLNLADKTLKPTTLVLRSASGNNCQLLGETTLNFSLQGVTYQQPVMVAKMDHLEMLLLTIQLIAAPT